MYTALSFRDGSRHLSRIVQGMLSMTGRVTMLGISRWAGRGGSDRSVQRFFNVSIAWPQVFVKFFEQHLYRPAGECFLVGDKSVVTKSLGRMTGWVTPVITITCSQRRRRRAAPCRRA
jgi:hypothetical protein